MNPHFDLARFIMSTIVLPIFMVIGKDKLKIVEHTNLCIALQGAPEYKKIVKYLPNLRERVTLQWCIRVLFLLHYPIVYHKYLGIDTDKYASYITDYPREQCTFYANIVKKLGSPTSMIKYIATEHL